MSSRRSAPRPDDDRDNNGRDDPLRKKGLSTQMKLAIGVLVFVLLVALGSKALGRARHRYAPEFVRQLQMLIRHAETLAKMAGQDTHPLIAYMHLTQAHANAALAKSMVSAEDISALVHVDINDLMDALEKHQQAVLEQIVQAAPTLQFGPTTAL